VRRRSVVGGPAPGSVKEMIENQRGALRGELERRKIRMELIALAEEKLVQAEQVLAASLS